MAAPTSSIIDPITSSSQKVEGNTRSARMTLWHQDLVTGATGSYRKSQTSGTIAAGLSAASLVYAFQWAPTPTGALCVPRRIALSAGCVTGFAAGFVNLQAFVARAYTVVEGTGGTAGTKTGNNSKLRTTYGTTLGVSTYISTTAAISGGTSTLDTDPFAVWSGSVTTTGGAPIMPAPVEIYRVQPGDQPLVFANQEGFVIKATVPGTGTWQLGVDVAWDEYPSGSF